MSKAALFAEKLSHYMPPQAAPLCAEWLLANNVRLLISRERNSKNGDYRAPYGTHGHRISVNGSLNQYAFLLTFVHEMAHLLVWEKYRGKVAPHGKEWKITFAKLMDNFLKINVFPEDIALPLINYLRNPAAASGRNMPLLRALRAYDTTASDEVALENLAEGSHFLLNEKRLFVKKEKLRKYFLCMDLRSEKMYKINGLAKVKPINH